MGAGGREVAGDGATQVPAREIVVYGIDGLDPNDYHLVSDGCALDRDTCVDLIVTASGSRTPRAANGA
jgi:hypothetical protein